MFYTDRFIAEYRPIYRASSVSFDFPRGSACRVYPIQSINVFIGILSIKNVREVVSYAAVCLCRHGRRGGLRDDTKETTPDSNPEDSNTVVWILNLCPAIVFKPID